MSKYKITIGNKDFVADKVGRIYCFNDGAFSTRELESLGATITEIKPEKRKLYAYHSPVNKEVIHYKSVSNPEFCDYIRAPQYDIEFGDV